MNRIITPFTGIDEFLLYQSVDETTSLLDKNKDPYTKEIWPNEESTNPVPWTIIRSESGMNFFFAKDKLFKIYVTPEFQGSLPNGICTGMQMEEATKVDPELKYDDWEEDWQSPNGYWIEDNLENHKVLTITIFIKEVLEDEVFEQYNW